MGKLGHRLTKAGRKKARAEGLLCIKTIRNGEKKGQPCTQYAAKGSNKCRKHGGTKGRTKAKRIECFYNMGIFKNRADHFLRAYKGKEWDLTHEMAMLRTALDTIVNDSTATPAQFRKAIGSIGFNLEGLRRLSETHHKQDTAERQSLKLDKLKEVIGYVVECVGRHVSDAGIRSAIAADLGGFLDKLEGGDNE